MVLNATTKDADMAKRLPYELITATGEKIVFEFPLHPETQSAVRVSQLLATILGAIDQELRVLGNTANGDVMQALAMALAARTAMLHAPYATGLQLASSLTATALAAAEHCGRDDGGAGHA